jgi:hypothetical protein
MIAIKNQSGSIAIRFRSQNRIPVLPVKSIHGCFLQRKSFQSLSFFSENLSKDPANRIRKVRALLHLQDTPEKYNRVRDLFTHGAAGIDLN